MAIVRWSPFSSFSRWPSIWDDEDFTTLLDYHSTNNLDVYETESEVVVRANVAGVPVDKVDVTFDKGVLWIRAQAQEESEEANKKHYRRAVWQYSYKVAVPGPVDLKKDPSAEVEDGVLTVRFTKEAAAQPRKLAVKNVKKSTEK